MTRLQGERVLELVPAMLKDSTVNCTELACGR